jgi:hypothetical protein
LVNNNNLSRNLTSQYNLANNANNHKDLKIFERLLNYVEDIEIFIFVINENIEQIFEKHDKLRIDPIKMSASLKLVKYTYDKTKKVFGFLFLNICIINIIYLENFDYIDYAINSINKYSKRIAGVKGKTNKIKCYTKRDTNDKDLKKLIDSMNEPTTKEFGYTNVINEKKYKVYKRLVKGIPVILIKAFV